MFIAFEHQKYMYESMQGLKSRMKGEKILKIKVGD